MKSTERFLLAVLIISAAFGVPNHIYYFFSFVFRSDMGALPESLFPLWASSLIGPLLSIFSFELIFEMLVFCAASMMDIVYTAAIVCGIAWGCVFAYDWLAGRRKELNRRDQLIIGGLLLLGVSTWITYFAHALLLFGLDPIFPLVLDALGIWVVSLGLRMKLSRARA